MLSALAVSFERLFRIAASLRSTAPGTASWRSTVRPEVATTCAMPPPIWPAPTTSTRSKVTFVEPSWNLGAV